MFARVSIGVAIVALDIGIFAYGQLELVDGHGFAGVAGNGRAILLCDLTSDAFILYHINTPSPLHAVWTHLEASTSNKTPLAERVGACEATEVQSTILIDTLAVVQSVPVEARLLLVSALVLGVGRAVESGGSSPVESGCSLLNSQRKGKKSSSGSTHVGDLAQYDNVSRM